MKIRTFKELIEVVEEIAKERNAQWLRHYLKAYLNNIHNLTSRLEYTYRIQRVLAQYDIYLSEELVVKMISGRLD